MYAVLTEVNAEASHTDEARKFLSERAVPFARDRGAKAGFWLAPQGGRGVAVVVFDTEDEAKQAASQFQTGQPPMPGSPAGVTVRSVEVREVLASLS